jgi:hypothetical protein
MLARDVIDALRTIVNPCNAFCQMSRQPKRSRRRFTPRFPMGWPAGQYC